MTFPNLTLAMMTRLDALEIAGRLTDLFGLALNGETRLARDGLHVDFQTMDVHPNEGFSIRTLVGWRHVLAKFEVGHFGGDLVMAMSQCSQMQKAQFSRIAEQLCAEGAKVSFALNGRTQVMDQYRDWPPTWSQIALEIERTPIAVDHEDPTAISDLIFGWAGRLLGLVITLLPVEQEEDAGSGTVDSGLPEGALQRVTVNKYERNRLNRALCISIHGTRCWVCGLSFVERYGGIGEDFIHVHHITPVSELGSDYVVCPTKDLVPVCPNCHAMLHRRDPPYTVEELRRMIASNGV